jgi:hypothetical protein
MGEVIVGEESISAPKVLNSISKSPILVVQNSLIVEVF